MDKRLTFRLGESNPSYGLKDKASAKPGLFTDYDGFYAFLLATHRLGQYEDTGLSPAEVAELAQVYRWIPIDERMPDSCGLKVLLTATNAFNQISVFSGFTGYMEHGKMEFHSNERDKDISKWHVTHWMPLPEPPISGESVKGE